MAVRKFETRETRQLKAYLVKGNNQPQLFYCAPSVIKNIENNFGQIMAADAFTITTTAQLDFKINDVVLIDNQTLTIESVSQQIWTGNFGTVRDKNALRGKVRYITTMVVQ